MATYKRRVLERQGDRFMERILTPAEREEYRESRQGVRLLAKRFCAKEAVVKALGTGIGRGVSWQDIQVEHDANGAPLVRLQGGAGDHLGGGGGRGGVGVEVDGVHAALVADDR